MYVGSLSILRKPRNGLSYETLLATVEQRLPADPALPPEGARGDAWAWPARCGSTTATSTSPTTSAGRRCRRRAATRSCTS